MGERGPGSALTTRTVLCGSSSRVTGIVLLPIVNSPRARAPSQTVAAVSATAGRTGRRPTAAARHAASSAHPDHRSSGLSGQPQRNHADEGSCRPREGTNGRARTIRAVDQCRPNACVVSQSCRQPNIRIAKTQHPRQPEHAKRKRPHPSRGAAVRVALATTRPIGPYQGPVSGRAPFWRASRRATCTSRSRIRTRAS